MTKPTLTVSAWVALLLALAMPQLPAAQTGPPRRVLAGDDSTQRLAIVAPDGSHLGLARVRRADAFVG